MFIQPNQDSLIRLAAFMNAQRAKDTGENVGAEAMLEAIERWIETDQIFFTIDNNGNILAFLLDLYQ